MFSARKIFDTFVLHANGKEKINERDFCGEIWPKMSPTIAKGHIFVFCHTWGNRLLGLPPSLPHLLPS